MSRSARNGELSTTQARPFSLEWYSVAGGGGTSTGGGFLLQGMIGQPDAGVLDGVAVGLFARWCQEDFFQYMGRHYGLDKLVEYATEPFPETTTVVNPAWRRLDQAIVRTNPSPGTGRGTGLASPGARPGLH